MDTSAPVGGHAAADMQSSPRPTCFAALRLRPCRSPLPGSQPSTATLSSVPGDLVVSRETLERLGALIDLTLLWNRRINLTAAGNAEQLWRRHVADSLQLAPFIPPRTRSGADLGSGGGYPGLVLAIATGLPFALLEADRRKAAFLTEAARVTDASVVVLCERIETACLEADLITSRATASLDTLLRWSIRLLRKGGICLFLKGAEAKTEIEVAEAVWDMRLEALVSRSHPAGIILRVEALAPKAMRPST